MFNLFNQHGPTGFNDFLKKLYISLGILLGLGFSIFNLEVKILIILNISFILISFALTFAFTDYSINNNPIIMKLLEVNKDASMRSLNITISNNPNLEGKELFKSIYETLMENQEFIDFGYQKIVILSCTLNDNRTYNLHSNIVICNDTTFEDYYLFIEKDLTNYFNLEYGYNFETIVRFNYKVWNADDMRNLKIKQTKNAVTYSKNAVDKAVKSRYYRIHKQNWVGPLNQSNIRAFSTSCSTSIKDLSYSKVLNKKWYKGLINPLSLVNSRGILKQKHPNPIFTMDIETINFSLTKVQIPIAISCCGFHKNKIETKIFLIDYKILQSDPELAVKQLWSNYFTYLESIIKNSPILDNLTIFAHNLGNFDGYFLSKGLLNHYNPEHVTSIIDESNSYISIKLNSASGFIFEWKDSLRIFPTSLDKLCKMFLVKGKLIPYNPKFQSVELFKNPKLLNSFKKYSKQDAVILYQALRSAQTLYFYKFKVDIESVYSTATLSLKIYRTGFQDKVIYILPSNIDLFIRNSYFGGGTDVYKAYAENVHYYDINSLYPDAMLEPMPYNILNNGKMINLTDRSLESFFGFAYVRIFCPLKMERPVLPFHQAGKTIYPVGTWSGVYFSQELKAVEKLGYQITLIRGYEFDKADLFSGFVNHFYEIKKYNKGVERDMAKLQLNNLYGYFGRKQITILTENIKNDPDNLNLFLLTRLIKSINKINDQYSTILSYTNLNYTMLESLNNELHSDIKSFKTFIKSNVAIAAAVTSYARIKMIPFKIDPNTLYTDTDSAFTTKPIDPSLIGIELGQMKDELKGNIIKEAYFIGPKKYGYYIIDKDTGQRKDFSVFSGVPRNSLSFNEVKSIFEGQIITKNIPNKFYKSFTSSSITIKDSKITIKNTSNKQLINNVYLPPKLHNGYHSYYQYLYNKFKTIIMRNLNINILKEKL